ncbi:MAG: NYN domain-containing protein, partial [Deltaproteobacteria bacterium]|nr:NYN domain-containing protein [Deltaproteobacteria bacterium]
MSVWAEPVATPNRDPRTQTGPTVHVVFVESADDWIVRRARRAEEPSRYVVVSADRKVAGRSRSAGCEIMTPWAFIARCPSGATTQPECSSTAKSKASMILDAFSSTARPLTSTIRQP